MMISKPQKLDMQCFKSCRPISLLYVLSKRLERYIAKHLAVTAVKQEVISQLQLGAPWGDQQ